jgi:hypothetical protein
MVTLVGTFRCQRKRLMLVPLVDVAVGTLSVVLLQRLVVVLLRPWYCCRYTVGGTAVAATALEGTA